MRTSTTAPKRNAYQRLLAKKSSYCKGRTTMAEVKKTATAYISAAVKKGKTKAEAEKSAKAILAKGCKMTSNIAGRKKAKGRTTTRRTAKKK